MERLAHREDDRALNKIIPSKPARTHAFRGGGKLEACSGRCFNRYTDMKICLPESEIIQSRTEGFPHFQEDMDSGRQVGAVCRMKHGKFHYVKQGVLYDRH